MSKTIPIERLTTGTLIYRKGGDFGPFGGFAEVQTVDFDIDGFYTIEALTMDTDGVVDWIGTDTISFTVDAGGEVEFGGRGEPRQRADSDIIPEEWAALHTACRTNIIPAHDEAIWRDIDALQHAGGYEFGRDVDAQLMRAVAHAIPQPADVQQIAAE
jgi:hypothetical protein